MKMLTFRIDDQLRLGVKTNKGILDIKSALEKYPSSLIPHTMQCVIEEGKSGIKNLEALVNQFLESDEDQCFLAEKELELGPCIPSPGKIICVGLNYKKHAEESNMPIPEYPILFNKFNNSISAHQDFIKIPEHAVQIDYEAELVIVIGEKAKKVSQEEALNYVLGYCNGNDLSIREWQFRTNQWLLGKSADGFCPIGPYLVTADEIKNPNSLDIKTYVNGEIRQISNTADMIFSCAELVSYISHHMTLQPGDIIMTGTPEGVIMGYPGDQQFWLQEGDEVTIEISELGQLRNQLEKEI